MSPEALTMESTHCVTRAAKPLPWRIARQAKCVRTCDAQSLPCQGARKARLTEYGFKNIDSDGVTWMKEEVRSSDAPSKLLLTIHVDDGLAACNDPRMYQAFLKALSKDFDLSDCGELTAESVAVCE